MYILAHKSEETLNYIQVSRVRNFQKKIKQTNYKDICHITKLLAIYINFKNMIKNFKQLPT